MSDPFAPRLTHSEHIASRYARASACDDAGELSEALDDEARLEEQVLAEQKAWKERGTTRANDDESEEGGTYGQRQ